MLRRPGLALALAALAALGGCAGGTPQPAQVKAAARDWAQRRLRPGTLEVTLVAVATDERRARVTLKADGRRYGLRLVRPGTSWRVARADLR